MYLTIVTPEFRKNIGLFVRVSSSEVD